VYLSRQPAVPTRLSPPPQPLPLILSSEGKKRKKKEKKDKSRNAPNNSLSPFLQREKQTKPVVLPVQFSSRRRRAGVKIYFIKEAGSRS
jgi:hypothetical protein